MRRSSGVSLWVGTECGGHDWLQIQSKYQLFIPLEEYAALQALICDSYQVLL